MPVVDSGADLDARESGDTRGLAHEELRTLRQRTSGGTDEAAKAGRYMGGIRSYGYRVEGEKGHARLVRGWPSPTSRALSR